MVECKCLVESNLERYVVECSYGLVLEEGNFGLVLVHYVAVAVDHRLGLVVVVEGKYSVVVAVAVAVVLQRTLFG